MPNEACRSDDVRADLGGQIDVAMRVSLIEPDVPVVVGMRELSTRYMRYAYHRIRVFLDRKGCDERTSGVHRIWCQSSL
jgi:hypothetical protein